jgi:hypothetical protein
VAERDIHGLWDIIQTNDFTVPISVSDFKADGTFTLQANQGAGEINGHGDGRVEGNMVRFVIHWDNDTTGAYNGAFNDQGFINGATFDILHPESVAGWRSSRSF